MNLCRLIYNNLLFHRSELPQRMPPFQPYIFQSTDITRFAIRKRMPAHRQKRIDKLTSQNLNLKNNTLHLKPLEPDPARFYLHHPELKALQNLRHLPSYSTPRKALPKQGAKGSSSSSTTTANNGGSSVDPQTMNADEPKTRSFSLFSLFRRKATSDTPSRVSKAPNQQPTVLGDGKKPPKNSIAASKLQKQQQQETISNLTASLAKLENPQTKQFHGVDPLAPVPSRLSRITSRLVDMISNITPRTIGKGIGIAAVVILFMQVASYIADYIYIKRHPMKGLPSAITAVPYVPFHPDTAPYDAHFFHVNTTALEKNLKVVDAQLFAIHAYFKHLQPQMKQTNVDLNTLRSILTGYIDDEFLNNPKMGFKVPAPHEQADVMLLLAHLVPLCQQYVEQYEKTSTSFIQDYPEAIKYDVERPLVTAKKIQHIAEESLRLFRSVYADNYTLHGIFLLLDTSLSYIFQKTLVKLERHSNFHDILKYRTSTLGRLHRSVETIRYHLVSDLFADHSKDIFLVRETRQLLDIVTLLTALHSSQPAPELIDSYKTTKHAQEMLVEQAERLNESRYFPLIMSMRFGYRTPRARYTVIPSSIYYLHETDEDYLLNGIDPKSVEVSFTRQTREEYETEREKRRSRHAILHSDFIPEAIRKQKEEQTKTEKSPSK